MNICYHWWAGYDNEPVYNYRNPVILSIANLRSFTKKPITVLDISKKENDWSYFPEKLNFEVKKIIPSMAEYSHIKGWELLSRIPDITSNFQEDIIYFDSDVFFFQNPFPLACDMRKFCWDESNGGIFYFNVKDNYKFLNKYKELSMECIESLEIREKIKSYCYYDAEYDVWDEMILHYIQRRNFYLFDRIPNIEHCKISTLSHENLKTFHGNGFLMENPITKYEHSRGLICLLVKEFNDQITKTLNADDLDLIFGKELIEYFSNKKISMLKNVSLFKKFKNYKFHYRGHFDITNTYKTQKI